MRGDGSIYKRGRVWWMKFYRDGRAIVLSCKTESKAEAKAKLAREVRASRSEDWLDPTDRKVTLGELAGALVTHYRVIRQKPKSAQAHEEHWRLHLGSVFHDMPAVALTTDRLREYCAARLKETPAPAPATLNREMQTLHMALKLAFECTPPKIARLPKFPWLAENNARKVFIDRDTEKRLKDAASRQGLWQRIFLEFAFTYGWRRGEIKFLRPRNISLAEGVIRLDTTKNGEAREVPITPELSVLLEAFVLGKGPDELLFPDAINKWDLYWYAICAAAGVKAGKKNGGIVLHDARRSSARNKRWAGVDTSVIMQIQGWRTDGMFRRYAIVNKEDMTKALEQEGRMDGQQGRYSSDTQA